MAEAIIDLAVLHGIPLKRDQSLTEILSSVETGREIPPELYRAVAEVLAFVYRITGKLHDGIDTSQRSKE